MRPRFANSSGSAAPLAASESRQRINLLLTDIMMPGMDGRELARRFKTECGDAPVIFMSGYSRLDLPQDSLLNDKFKIGADASVAAGPVGRHAAAGTDIKLNAEILSYSRSKGAFAGISLDGAVVQADHSGDKAMCGSNVTRQGILNGKVAVPKPARSLLEELARYAGHR